MCTVEAETVPLRMLAWKRNAARDEMSPRVECCIILKSLGSPIMTLPGALVTTDGICAISLVERRA